METFRGFYYFAPEKYVEYQLEPRRQPLIEHRAELSRNPVKYRKVVKDRQNRRVLRMFLRDLYYGRVRDSLIGVRNQIRHRLSTAHIVSERQALEALLYGYTGMKLLKQYEYEMMLPPHGVRSRVMGVQTYLHGYAEAQAWATCVSYMA